MELEIEEELNAFICTREALARPWTPPTAGSSPALPIVHTCSSGALYRAKEEPRWIGA